MNLHAGTHSRPTSFTDKLDNLRGLISESLEVERVGWLERIVAGIEPPGLDHPFDERPSTPDELRAIAGVRDTLIEHWCGARVHT